MSILTLPASFEQLLSSGHAPTELLSLLVERVGKATHADRCFLYVRQPAAGRGRIAFCWCKNESIPNVIQPDWQEDTTHLPQEDPLFRAALAARPSVYVDDVKMARPDVLNRDFEDRTFGHQALIHAHVTEGTTLWGILQPAVFGRPHYWTNADQGLMETLLPRLVPVIKAFTATENRQ